MAETSFQCLQLNDLIEDSEDLDLKIVQILLTFNIFWQSKNIVTLS